MIRCLRKSALVAGIAALSIAPSGSAVAQAPPASPPPAHAAPSRSATPQGIIVPVLAETPDVGYPEGAHGDAMVLLTLTVAADGSVQRADAPDAEEPFRSAAVRAALGWRFVPARRGDQPVAARIRFELRFREPTIDEEVAPSAEPPTESVPRAGAARAANATAPRPIEVTVGGERRPPGVVSFTRAEVRQLPGAFGDPFRAIEALPGVTPIVSGVPFFYVRGAPPGNVGYFLDGIRVPYLYHVGLGPAVIHPGMVERVDLYPGGYPAQFGRFSGGIVAAETTAPRPQLRGEANVRLFDLGALVETGFAGGKGTALLGGRYSYTAALLSLIARDVTLDYRDFEARVTYDITPDDRISLFAFGSYDLIGQTQDNVLNVLFGSEFYRLDSRYAHRFGPRSSLRAAVTLGLDKTKIPGQPRIAYARMVNARVDASHELGPGTLRGGVDVAVDAYRADVRPYSDPDDTTVQQFNELFPARSDVSLGVFADMLLRLPGVEVTPGLRVDYYRSGEASALALEPRLASRIELSRSMRVLHALGIAHQPPSFLIPVPGLAIGSLQGGLQTSLQASAALEVDLPDATTATAGVFDNVFLNMSDTIGVRQRGSGANLAEQRSLGAAIGFELYVRRKLTRRVGGFLSYTLARSTRSVGDEHFPSAFDRTHVANAALAFDLGRGFRAGARLVLYTGAPTQPAVTGLITPPRSASPPRDPVFYRVDLRVEKRWVYSPSLWLSVVAEMMNATLHKEVLSGQEIGPVSIPSLGVEMGF